MVLVKILKRKDAASVLVAVLLAMILSQPLMTTTMRLAGNIAGTESGPYGSSGMGGTDWQSEYLFPAVWAILQILLLEILCWVYIWVLAVLRRARR